MSTILLAGIVDKEAAAIEIMVGMYWREHTCVTLGRNAELSLPRQSSPACTACQLCIVDLFGLGMRRHSEAHEQRLLEFLGRRPAVLLVRGLETGWMERAWPVTARQQVQCLMAPYNAQSLRNAISQLLQAQEALPDTTPQEPTRVPNMPSNAGTANAPLPAWRRAEEFAKRLQQVGSRPVALTAPPLRTPLADVDKSVQPAPALATPTTAVPLTDWQASGWTQKVAPALQPLADQAGAAGLGRGAMESLLAMCPMLRSLPIVALAMKIVTSKSPQLLKVQPDTEIVLNFRQGWLVSNLSILSLRKLASTLTPQLASSAHAVQLSEPYIESLVRQRFNGRFLGVQVALDEVTWHLLGDAIKDQTLVPTGDMRIQLRRFPNFNALGDTTSFDIQLATLCACAPHWVSDLLRAFPRQEQAVLRFVVLATASGLMGVLADESPNAQAQQGPAPVAWPKKSLDPEPQVRAQRSFFKSLLEKLF